MTTLEPSEIFRAENAEVYSASGTREYRYGIFNPETGEWHTAGRKWNPIDKLLPTSTYYSYDKAKRHFNLLKERPSGAVIVKIMVVYMPTVVVSEETNELVRQEEDGEGPERSESEVV